MPVDVGHSGAQSLDFSLGFLGLFAMEVQRGDPRGDRGGLPSQIWIVHYRRSNKGIIKSPTPEHIPDRKSVV